MHVSNQDTVDSERVKAASWQRRQMRPFLSDIFQRPGITLNARADCAAGSAVRAIRCNPQAYHAERLLPESRKQLLNVGETKVLAA